MAPQPPDSSRLQRALRVAETSLLARRTPAGVWTGELSASALSTATALVALTLAQRGYGKAVAPPLSARHPEYALEPVIERGFDWLAAHANSDGGWGDTVLSLSNLSTTTLVWAALGLSTRLSPSRAKAVENAEKWLLQHAGSLVPGALAAKIIARYGTDRTFSAPILTHCALAGRMGDGSEAWRHVIPLPFELAACPASWFAALRLPVVSYALPALIAVGYARHVHAPSGFPLLRALRSAVASRVFRVLDSIQPPNGGFLEAVPLTSFVVMSLAGSGKLQHPVTQRGIQFILNSAQREGSWRIDTNLSTWLTTLSTNALSSAKSDLSAGNPADSPLPPPSPFPLPPSPFTPADFEPIYQFLLRQQYRARHPYTNAAPGGWAWTDLPGGVPDADDTPGALLALKALGGRDDAVFQAAAAGVKWLLDLQNRDGGIPTFCRGWGALPFDRSSADLTAHCLRAWAVWRSDLPPALDTRVARATEKAVKFLRRTQDPSGAWLPLWFGNEFEPDESNRVYGTSRVLLALSETGLAPDCAEKAAHWLAEARKPDGGWSGGLGPAPSSVEETALAVEALAALFEKNSSSRAYLETALRLGTDWLIRRVEAGTWATPAPIGFYFAKLWYFENLYPVIFTVAALRRAARAEMLNAKC